MDEYSRKFFDSLSEKDRRRFVALEAHRRGRNGVKEVSEFYEIHPHTIRRGKDELEEGLEGDRVGYIRRPGGEEKRLKHIIPILIWRFFKCYEITRQEIRWMRIFVGHN